MNKKKKITQQNMKNAWINLADCHPFTGVLPKLCVNKPEIDDNCNFIIAIIIINIKK